jgi:hypothetical protein
MKCLVCGEEFECSRKSPICATEESRGFKRLLSVDKDELISGNWIKDLKKKLKNVNYKKLVPDENFKLCICFKCMTGENEISKGTETFYRLKNMELLHFYFGGDFTSDGLKNNLFPSDSKIIILCYGKDAVALDYL